MRLPTQTPEYIAARKLLDEKHWKPLRDLYWPKHVAGEITHREYQDLIEPGFKKYSKALEKDWIKAGGTPTKKEKKEKQ